MASLREPDPLAAFLVAQHKRALEGLACFQTGEGSRTLSKTRTIVRALRDAEVEILYPALGRLQLPPAIEYLLNDSRDSRARQLDALDALARQRQSHLRKLRAIELADRMQHHAQQHVGELIPALASRVPRPMYRAIASRFVERCQLALEPATPERQASRRVSARAG